MILVTGATGFIGEQLVRCLLQRGEQVRILVRSPEKAQAVFGPLAEHLEIFRGDLGVILNLDETCRGVTNVYHCASLIAYKGDWDYIHRVNVQGTGNLLNACLVAGVQRVVHISSIAAGGPALEAPDGPLPRTEADSPSPLRDPYGRSKLAQEELALRYNARGLEVVVVRPGAVFGPGDPEGINRLLRLVRRGRLPFYLSARSTVINTVYVRDVVEGSILAMERGRPGEVYNLVGPNLTHQELFRLLARVSGGWAPSWVMPRAILLGTAWLVAGAAGLFGRRPPFHPNDVRSWTAHWMSSGSKAEQELGLTQTDPETAWAETLAWLRI